MSQWHREMEMRIPGTRHRESENHELGGCRPLKPEQQEQMQVQPYVGAYNQPSAMSACRLWLDRCADSGDTDTLQGTPPRQTHSLIQAQTPKAAPEHHTTRAISVDYFIPLTVRLHDAGAVSHKEFADFDTRRATAMNGIV